MNKFVSTFLLLLFFKSAFSQNQNNIWYFGTNAGISFNSTPPVALNDGVVYTAEGVSSICDKNGDLLFFTDGISVWNKHLQVMPNGTDLLGHSSSSQSALIIPHPGNCYQYYIFTSPSQDSITPMCYSLVDMTADGGTGDVISKNNQLYRPVTERLTGTLQSNGTDYWVVAQKLNSNGFLSFSVTATGINTTPVISYAGPPITSTSDVLGYMKISPNGSKLSYASLYGSNPAQLFDFDNTTGIVSNNIPLVNYAGYGVEFSPDNSKLYFATANAPFIITQYDLNAGAAAAIRNSATEIVNKYIIDNTVHYGGALQLGPDNKIYACRLQREYLSVINDPNLAGTNCNYIEEGVDLGMRKCQDGLPNHIKNYAASLNQCSPIPLKLISFIGKNNAGVTELNWTTTNEINTAYFIIEKSYDGNSFVEIQKTKALNRLNNIYTVTDNKSLSGNVYYRLKQVDNNGDFTYSNIIVVRFDRVLAPFINTAIAKNILHLLYESNINTKAEIKIFDVNGRMLYNNNTSITKGMNDIPIKIHQLSAGTYILMLQQNDYNKSIKFIKGNN